jgi:hypothetical protein
MMVDLSQSVLPLSCEVIIRRMGRGRLQNGKPLTCLGWARAEPRVYVRVTDGHPVSHLA